MSSSRYSDASSSSRRSQPGGPDYRDRFRVDGQYSVPVLRDNGGEMSIGRLQTLITRAVRPTQREPDLALNLSIADAITELKGGAPRAAAMAIVEHINSRNNHVAVLALSVLDVCVKNCGYPFHLQISRKDFLNALVRRFPARPPISYTRVQLLILEFIEEWNQTLAKTSRYRDDLGHIRDMHRLLIHKGYTFPEVNRDDAAVLTAPDALKSAAELAKEDRELQEAKLQELIRSGTSEDLKEANHLMSVMAGFRESQVDYHAKVAKDLDKLRRKAEILEEMLNNLAPGDSISNDDVFSELVDSLRTAAPKIKKIIETEDVDEDQESLDKVTSIYDYVTKLVQKYDLVVAGQFDEAANLSITSLGGTHAKIGSRQALIASLIDIGDAEMSAPAPEAAGDLLGLDFGGLTLGGGDSAPIAKSSGTIPASNPTDLLGDLFGPTAPSAAAAAAPAAAPLVSAPADFAPTAISSSSGRIALNDESVKIEFFPSRTGSETHILIKVSNPSDKKITDFKLELSAPKSRSLKIGQSTGSSIDPRKVDGITQKAVLENSTPVKLRWRLSFRSGLSAKEFDGFEAEL